MSGIAANTECIILVLLEMGLSFFGIVSNLLIVTTLRQEEGLKGSTINYLLFNLCFSNLVISFLVKPISAIYIGYAVSTGEVQVRKNLLSSNKRFGGGEICSPLVGLPRIWRCSRKIPDGH